jgi:uncharacterized protein (DUF983 family)|tara:strand:+ start:2767 stop:2919 length:153 start_codon:yes stop_codon:yes gene_type:complete
MAKWVLISVLSIGLLIILKAVETAPIYATIAISFIIAIIITLTILENLGK